MRELFAILARNSKWIVFAVYTILSCILLFTRNPYQQHVYLTSAGQLTAGVYGVTSNVTSYFNLRANNEDLNRRNADLQLEAIALREQVQSLTERIASADTVTPFEALPLQHFSFIVAHVVNNSVTNPHNYITIDKGSDAGVAPEMGVIDAAGVVGIVNVVTPHYARVISLLNPHFRLSCKIKGNDSFGSLVWDGRDPRQAVLEELPRHTQYHRGDTVVTSGYSAVFPEGIPVGVVIGDNAAHTDNFFTLRVRLLSNFTKLNNVQVVVNRHAGELDELEEANMRTEGAQTNAIP